jgi:diguanylate cyclase (GGDEF)-like protein
LPQTVRDDFSAHVRARLSALQQRVEGPDAVLSVLREAHAHTDPAKVAAWLVGWASEAIPAPCWVVVSTNTSGQRIVLAEKGLTAAALSVAWEVAERVSAGAREMLVGDLAAEPGFEGASGTVMAFPLVSRRRTVGVLMALDPRPSASAPVLGDSLLAMLRVALEPAAIALDNALTLSRAEALSVTDDLTGLANSRYLGAILRREEKRSVRSGRPLSLLFIDLDGFKDINTKYGHQAGSRTLVEVGGVIRSCARETDVVARYGGDEFAVVLPDTVVHGASFVARRICERIRTSRYLTEEGLFIQLTASVGIATLPDAATSAEELLRAADRAMYRVKNAGKNGLHIAEKDI